MNLRNTKVDTFGTNRQSRPGDLRTLGISAALPAAYIFFASMMMAWFQPQRSILAILDSIAVGFQATLLSGIIYFLLLVLLPWLSAISIFRDQESPGRIIGYFIASVDVVAGIFALGFFIGVL